MVDQQPTGRVQVFNVGLGDEHANITFFRDKRNIGWNTLIAEKVSNDMKEVTVEITKFEEWAAEQGVTSFYFAKIDVEGAEYKVLRGMKNFLKSLEQKPYLFIEIGWGTDHPNWNEEKAELEWLWKEGGYEEVALPTKGGTIDVLFEPKKKKNNNWER